MKNIFVGFMAVFVLNFYGVVAQADGSLELSVTTLKPSKKEASEITVILKNKGSEAIEIPSIINPQNQWLRFELTTSKGEALQFSGKLSASVEKNQKLILYPEHFWGRHFKLADLFPIAKNGSYRLKVTYGVGPDGKNILTESLTSEIDVVIKDR